MGAKTAIIWSGMAILLGVPSCLIAGVRARPWWLRAAAVLPAPIFFLVLMLQFPTYPAGENIDDWRRGCATNLSIVSGVGSAALQTILGIAQVMRRRRQKDLH